jgi:hypothetical protein
MMGLVWFGWGKVLSLDDKRVGFESVGFFGVSSGTGE